MSRMVLPTHGPLSGRLSRWLPGIMCGLLQVLAAGLFLPHQGLWGDEATQLSGVRLGPLNQVRWLLGTREFNLGVAEDRMPPLSYLAGSLWSSAVAPGERSLRWMGVAAVAIATLIVYDTAWRAWGNPSAVSAGLLFGLSPGVVTVASQVRAYPLFLLSSAVMFSGLARWLDDDARTPGVTRLSLAGAASIGTHFFGLLASLCALASAWFLADPKGRSKLTRGVAVVALATLLVVPFATTAARRSGESQAEKAGEWLLDVSRLAYRLVLHASMRVYPWVVTSVVVGTVAAGIAATSSKVRGAGIARGLSISVLLGICTVIMVRMTFGAPFNAAAPSYNLWMLPPLAVAASSGLAAVSSQMRALASAGLFVLVVGFVMGDVVLAQHGDSFSQGAYPALGEIARSLGPGRFVVVFDGDDPSHWDLASPFRYEFGNDTRIWAHRPGTGLGIQTYPAGGERLEISDLRTDHVIVVRSTRRDSAQVAQGVREGFKPLGDGPLTKQLKTDRDWRLVREKSRHGYISVEIDVFERVGP